MLPDIKTNIRLITSVLVVTVMVFAAELLGENEMIFPEVAALCAGMLVSRKMPWRADPIRIFVMMSLASAGGYLLAVWSGVPLLIKLLLSLIICLTSLHFTKCTMLPVISAMILPVLTNVYSLIYPISVTILTAAVIALRELFIKKDILNEEKADEADENNREALIRGLFILSVTIAAASAAVILDRLFIVAPPLIVALAEGSEKDSAVFSDPLKIFLAISLSALTGSCCRLVMCVLMGLPLTGGAMAAAAISLYMLYFMKKLFPPAAALGILPFLLPAQTAGAYPFMVMSGAAFFITACYVYHRFRKSRISQAPAVQEEENNEILS